MYCTFFITPQTCAMKSCRILSILTYMANINFICLTLSEEMLLRKWAPSVTIVFKYG